MEVGEWRGERTDRAGMNNYRLPQSTLDRVHYAAHYYVLEDLKEFVVRVVSIYYCTRAEDH